MEYGASVPVKEAPAIIAGKWFLAKGFVLASCCYTFGILQSLVDLSQLSVFVKKVEETGPRTYFFGLVTLKSKTLTKYWRIAGFNFKYLGATERNWTMQVYGRSYLDEMKEFAAQMIATHGVQIDLCLMSEEPEPVPDEYPSHPD